MKPTWQVDVWDVYFYQMFYVEVEEQVLERLCPMFIYPNFQLLNLTSGLTVGTNSLHLKYLLFSFLVSTKYFFFSKWSAPSQDGYSYISQTL